MTPGLNNVARNAHGFKAFKLFTMDLTFNLQLLLQNFNSGTKLDNELHDGDIPPNFLILIFSQNFTGESDERAAFNR